MRPPVAESRVPSQPSTQGLEARKSTWTDAVLGSLAAPLSPVAQQMVRPPAAAASKALFTWVTAIAVHALPLPSSGFP